MRRFLIFLGVFGAFSHANASIDDAISRALEAIGPYAKQGYTVRDDQWGGDLGVKEEKAIPHTLFRGRFAAARVMAPATGTYYVIVEVASSPRERTTWAMVYGFK